jgi:ATP-dependent helicase HrpA
MNVRIVDEARRELAMGRDLGELRRRLGEAASLTLSKSKPGMEREGITVWDFGDLPEQVTFRRDSQTLTGYPALVDEDASVAIRLMDTRDKADAAHRAGVKRLMSLGFKEPLRGLERSLPGFNALALKFSATIPADKLRDDLLEAIVDRAFIGEDEPPRTQKAFEEQKKRAKSRLPAVTEAAPWEKLEHLPRYLKGYALRLQKYPANAERDQKHAATVANMWLDYEARAKSDRDAGRHDPRLEEFRWLIEELRVSLFAQELRTPQPVSAKRLQKFWNEHLR